MCNLLPELVFRVSPDRGGLISSPGRKSERSADLALAGPGCTESTNHLLFFSLVGAPEGRLNGAQSPLRGSRNRERVVPGRSPGSRPGLEISMPLRGG